MGKSRNEAGWRAGRLHVDTESVTSRSDVVSTEPLAHNYQAMPLGNGRLAAMVWNEDGLTAQLNRADTWPDLRSAGCLVLPGLAPLESQTSSRLSLYDATLHMEGGGLAVSSRVPIDLDVLVVEVSGADPEVEQIADVRLWEKSRGRGSIYQPALITRSPEAFASGGIAGLWETFEGRGHETHGFVTALSAMGRDVRAEVVSPTAARIRFRPQPDGSFRIAVAVPSFSGGDPLEEAERLIQSSISQPLQGLFAAHDEFWHRFWEASHLRLDSPDGEANYLENLRNLYLYLLRSAAEPESPWPAAAGGASAAPFAFAQDYRDWGTLFLHWNTRNATWANSAANHLELTEPYRRYYLGHLERWRAVAARWGKPGACVPEVTTYDGDGDGGGGGGGVTGISANGLEIAWALWEQYRFMGVLDYLRSVYPLMRDAARFHLASLVEGDDGKLHILDSAAGETYLHVDDPIPDLAGMRAVFPAVIEASRLLNEDAELRADLASALARLAEYPRDPEQGDVLVAAAPRLGEPSNYQNPELDLVFPFGLVGDDDAMTDLMRRTFAARRFPLSSDWAPDAIWAARLGLADQARKLAAEFLEHFQAFPAGFTYYIRKPAAQRADTVYLEGVGITATAVQEMVLQSYDGIIRVAPAWPAQWSGSFTLRAVGGFLVSSEVDGGRARYVGIESLLGETLRIRNPWPGEPARLRTDAGEELLTTAAALIEAPTARGGSYVLEPLERPLSSFSFVPIGGEPSDGVKLMGRAQLGVGAAPPRADLIVGVTDIAASEHAVRMILQVRNVGRAASAPTTVRVLDATVMPPRVIGEVPVPSVPCGGAVQASFDWDTTPLPDGVYRIAATVNPDREVVELDGTNNEAWKAIRIGSPPAGADVFLAAERDPEHVIDTHPQTLRSSARTPMPHWVELDLARGAPISNVVVRTSRLPATVVHDLDIAILPGPAPFVARKSAHTRSVRDNTAADVEVEYPALMASIIRVTVLRETCAGEHSSCACVAEIEVYDTHRRRVL